jgi:hypothetical protein
VPAKVPEVIVVAGERVLASSGRAEAEAEALRLLEAVGEVAQRSACQRVRHSGIIFCCHRGRIGVPQPTDGPETAAQ